MKLKYLVKKFCTKNVITAIDSKICIMSSHKEITFLPGESLDNLLNSEFANALVDYCYVSKNILYIEVKD